MGYDGSKGAKAALHRAVVLAREFHAQRKHVLILGPAGVGKSALVEQMRGALPLILCPKCSTMKEICECLETDLNLPAADARLVQRKQSPEPA